MNYRNKRNAKRLTIYTVSSRLGLDYNTYLEIERGEKNLEGIRLDKFQDILNNASQIKIERAQKMIKVRDWFRTDKAREALQKYGYSGAQLGRILGVSQSHISNVFNNRSTSDDLMERIYDFLHDSLNKGGKATKETVDYNIVVEDEEEQLPVLEDDTKEIEINIEENTVEEEKKPEPSVASIEKMRIEALEREVTDLREQLAFYKKMLNTMGDLVDMQKSNNNRYQNNYNYQQAPRQPRQYNNNYGNNYRRNSYNANNRYGGDYVNDR